MSYLVTAVAAVAVLMLCAQASAKTGSTLYPSDRVANARRNIERFDWAREIRDRAVAAADQFARQPNDFLWELVTPQSIPRGIHVNVEQGCPKCGKDIDRFGNYPWKCDVFNKPWKIECPSCGEIFPKNDFGAFYESGKDEHGVFDPNRADRSLLYNTQHPDPSDPLHTYGVDDGLGWKRADGEVFRFIGYYGHYGSWGAVFSALRWLRDAYLYTGDSLYAEKAGLMLYRAAQFYPDMDWSACSKLGFFNSDGLSGLGKIYGRIWETGAAKTLIAAYDAVYPGFEDPSLLDYLSSKVGKPVDAAGARSLIEHNIIQEVHDSILTRQIAGNEGMHQSAMAMAAIVLDDPSATRNWLGWVFAPGDLLRGNPNGGNIARLFEQKIDNDGMGNEAAPSYNGLWRAAFRAISEMLEHYPSYKGCKITDFPRYRKMFETPVRLICLDKYIPNIGDCGKTGNPGTGGIGVEELVYAFKTFKDPIFAQMAYYLNGDNVDGLRGNIFDAEPEGVADEIEAVVRNRGPYVPHTEELPSYGLAILRGGSGENACALTLYYGRNTGHGHCDTLNIELFGHGVDLMPDLGYPEYASVWPKRLAWTDNTISHNTVVVDRKKQGENRLGKARFVKSGDGVSAAEVYAQEPYPQTSLYQRTVAMVDVSEKDFYVVDIFRVQGGGEYHYSLHGPEGEIQTEGLELVAQRKGTLAGEDVDFGADLGGRETYWKDASGFQYLYDVRRDKSPAACPAITCKVKDTWGVLRKGEDLRLRMHLVQPPGEVILAHGDPPQNKPGNPRRLTYVILPDDGGSSTFVSVIESYSGLHTIEGIERTDSGGAVTLKIRLASGRVDYISSSLSETKLKAAGREYDARFAVLSDDHGNITERLIVH